MEPAVEWRQRKRGFTLTELLTTVGTISILASLLLPGLHATKRKARDLECRVNQRNLKTDVESVYQDVNPDYHNHNFTEKEEAEYELFFTKDCTQSLIPDPYLHNLGVYVARNLTCPYAFGDGKTRAWFGVLPSFKEISDTAKKRNQEGINYITFTYNINSEFISTRENSSTSPAVFDSFNYDILFNAFTTRDLFPQSERGTGKRLFFNNKVLHPHKGSGGAYVTFGTGLQQWITPEKLGTRLKE